MKGRENFVMLSSVASRAQTAIGEGNKFTIFWAAEHLRYLSRTFKNWPALYFDAITARQHGFRMLKLRSGVQFVTRPLSRDISDAETIVENWDMKQYFDRSSDLSKAGVVVDIGAHIGSFAVYAALILRAEKVFCYEPVEQNFNLLKNNIQLNHIKTVKSYNLGVASTPGPHKISTSGTSAQWSLYDANGENSGSVNCTTLENIFQENEIDQCDLLKVDCEGAEYEILLGTGPDILRKIGRICLEYHRSGEKVHERLLRYLADCGFGYSVKENQYAENLGLIFAVRN